MAGEGLRFNQNKLRYDLLEPFAVEQLAKVFTKGAEKYAPHNWEKGMDWSKISSSLKRHIAAWEKGEDFDYDPTCKECLEGTCKNHTGLYHMAHAAWNALALVSYYRLYPQGDDRQHSYLNHPKIGLDIDEVICNFTKGWHERWGVDPNPHSWYYDRDMGSRFKEMKESGELDSFYLSLEPKINPRDIPFEPHCYVTSRPVSTEVTEAWLRKHEFPEVPVYTVPTGASKVEALKQAGVEIFVDDAFHNFTTLNKAGICTFLWDAPHNQRYNVGFKRIKSFSELIV